MYEWMDTCLVAILVLDLYILGTSRLIAVIQATIVQGMLLGILPLTVHSQETIHHWILSISVLLSNVFLMPYLAILLIRKVEIRREVEPFLEFTPSLMIGMAIAFISFWIAPYSQKILQLPQHFPRMLMPAAITTAMSGFIILATRRKAVTQVLGYLVMENGIYIWGLTLLDKMPLLVELGVILGIFMTVMVMATVCYRVYLRLGHVNVDELSNLKG
jgi:hydrogenase-4 component E